MNTHRRSRTRAIVPLIASLALGVGLLGLSGCVAYPVGGYYGGYYAPGYAYAPRPGAYVGGGYGYYHGYRRGWR